MNIKINKYQIDKILLVGFVITFFSKDFFFNFYFKNIYIDIFSYTFFTIIFFFYINLNFFEWKKIYFITLIVLGIEFNIKIINSFSLIPLLKQLLPIIIIYVTTYFFIKKNSFKQIFDYYLKILFVLCIFGIIQFILDYFFNIYLFQLVPGRIDSIFREPSHYASMLVPALIYTILNFKKYQLFTIIIGINLALTISVAGYFALFSTFILILFTKEKRKIFLASLCFIFLFIFSVSMLEKKNLNNGFLSSILKKEIILKDLSKNINFNFISNNFKNNVNNLGIYSVSSNLAVTANFLMKNPLGAGLGGHEEAYYYYTNKYQMYGSFYQSSDVKLKRYGYNSKSAHSLLIRLVSEFGIIFIAIILFIINKLILNLKKYTNEEMVIIITCISYFLFRFMKLGGYFDYGIYFFLTAFLFIIFHQNESNKYNNYTNQNKL